MIGIYGSFSSSAKRARALDSAAGTTTARQRTVMTGSPGLQVVNYRQSVTVFL